ncbi:hypothetical protein AVEN_210277-1 [Araneus ventricosus]|uniref:Uncharacterized protein n=1 Tax=Araneus ventricosus TaxID=182803 RepID=A0A4Y2JTC3_ARAVE|nr:hypothetical protein AVEN_210277-1 [Araneus ventricosus]
MNTTTSVGILKPWLTYPQSQYHKCLRYHHFNLPSYRHNKIRCVYAANVPTTQHSGNTFYHIRLWKNFKSHRITAGTPAAHQPLFPHLSPHRRSNRLNRWDWSQRQVILTTRCPCRLDPNTGHSDNTIPMSIGAKDR